MRSRSLSALGHGSHDASISLPFRWSHEGIDERRGGGRPNRQRARFFSVKTWPQLAARISLIVLATVFAASFLYTRRRHGIRNDDVVSAGSASIFPSPRHHGHRLRAQAHRAFASSSPSAAVDALAATGFRDASKAIAGAPLPFTGVFVSGGELVQRIKPASLVIVVPFTLKDAVKVIEGLEKWPRPGDPCAMTRLLGGKNSTSGSDVGAATTTATTGGPVDLLFWFNRDLDDKRYGKDSKEIKKEFLQALEPSSHCFGRVEFASARLSDDEDAYPLGPSNQWYKLFLSPERPLAPYDYAFWCEHDVAPVQSGWVDALLLEVTFRGDFFVKGSIHRGRKLDDIVIYPDDASWVTHINGNALYKANDFVFTAMISQCREANRGSKSFLSSFDVAMWIQHITSYASKWQQYQSYAHKFQYTDLIQNLYEDVSWPKGARGLVARSPSTFLVHGSSASAGEEHRKRTHEKGVAVEAAKLVSLPSPAESTGEELVVQPLRPKSFLPEKVAVVIPLVASQIEMLRVLFSLASKDAFRACDPDTWDEPAPIDLVFHISSTWLDESGAKGNEAYRSLATLLDEFPRFTSCFGEVHLRAASLMPSEDIHNLFTGPNLQFRRMMDDNYLRSRFSHVLLLEPDATPIKRDWLERLWLEARGSGTEESFWIKGTAYRGFRGDWVRNPNPYNITTVSSMWAAMNGNGIYNLQDPEFYEFMDRVWEAHPALPFDAAMHAYLFDVENFDHTKRALTKIRYSSYVQNHVGTRFDIATIRRESPETYIVHSSCREEFPDKKSFCFVCDRDTPWSEDCQIKLNSYDVYLGYDRYTTGPDYRGPEISNANERELWRLTV